MPPRPGRKPRCAPPGGRRSPASWRWGCRPGPAGRPGRRGLARQRALGEANATLDAGSPPAPRTWPKRGAAPPGAGGRRDRHLGLERRDRAEPLVGRAIRDLRARPDREPKAPPARFLELVHPEDRPLVDAAAREALRTGSTRPSSASCGRGRMAGGRSCAGCSAAAGGVGAAGPGRAAARGDVDITDRHLAEQRRALVAQEVAHRARTR